MNTIDFNFNPIDWLTRMVVLLEQQGVISTVETFAYSLAAALFAYGVIRAIWYGRGSEIAVLAGRTLLVIGLVALIPLIRSTVFITWTSVYSWSSSVWSAEEEGVFKRLFNAAEATQTVLPNFLTASYAVQAASSRQYDATTEGLGAEEPSDAADMLSQLVTWVALLIFTAMLPLLFGVYTVIIFVSGMTVLIGVALLPIAAVLLLVPGGAAVSWFGAWVRMNAGALFVVVFLPLAISIVVELGVAQPLERTNETMQQSLERFNQSVIDIEGAFQTLRSALSQVGPLPGNAQATAYSARQAIYAAGESLREGVLSILIGWLFGILTILVGFLLGLFLLFRTERYVMGFLGGLASGVSAPSFLARALVYRGLKALTSPSRFARDPSSSRTPPIGSGKAYRGSQNALGPSSASSGTTDRKTQNTSRLPPPRRS